MATRTSSLRYLAAALVAGFAFSLAPSAADADQYPRAKRYSKAPRVVYHAPYTAPRIRVRTHVQRICFDYAGRPFDCRMPAPIAPRPRTVYVPVPQPVPVVHYQPAYTTCGSCAPVIVPAPRYYGTGCGSCGHSVQPYYWTARYTWHRRHARHHHHHH